MYVIGDHAMSKSRKKKQSVLTIREYVRNKSREKIGVVIAKVDVANKQCIGLGWSQVHKNKESFRQDQAISIAEGRATPKGVRIPIRLEILDNNEASLAVMNQKKIPRQCRSKLLHMAERVSRILENSTNPTKKTKAKKKAGKKKPLAESIEQ